MSIPEIKKIVRSNSPDNLNEAKKPNTFLLYSTVTKRFYICVMLKRQRRERMPKIMKAVLRATGGGDNFLKLVLYACVRYGISDQISEHQIVNLICYKLCTRGNGL